MGSRFREEKISPCFHEFTPSLQSIGSVVSPRDGRSCLVGQCGFDGFMGEVRSIAQSENADLVPCTVMGCGKRFRKGQPHSGRFPFRPAKRYCDVRSCATSRTIVMAAALKGIRCSVCSHGQSKITAGDCGPTPIGHAPAKYSGVCPTIFGPRVDPRARETDRGRDSKVGGQPLN